MQKERRSSTRVVETDGEQVEYKVVCLDARAGAEIQDMLGSALAGFFAVEADPRTLVAAFFANGLRIGDLADRVMPEVYVEDRSLGKSWPHYFANDWAALDAVILFALEVNFGNFTDKLPKLLARYLPSTSAGPESARG